MDFKFLLAVSTLVGTIVGVGFFGLPYVISKIGFFPGILYLFFLALVYLYLHLLFSEIILRTKEKRRLPGFAQKYLGNFAKKVLFFSSVVGISLTLICYIIAGGNFLSILTKLPIFLSAFILWAFFSIAIALGLKTISQIEFFMMILFSLAIFFIFFGALPKIKLENLAGFYPKNLLLPFGVILFSMAGTAGIPTIREILSGKEKKLKKAIIWGTLIPAFFYAIFAFSVVGVSGKATSQEAIEGLVSRLGKGIIFLGAIFGIMTITTSYLSLGIYLSDILFYDFKVRKFIGLAYVTSVGALGIVLGKDYLIPLMGLSGTVLSAFEAIILILIAKKAKIKGEREPEYQIPTPNCLFFFLIFIFFVGFVYQIYLLLSYILKL